ncbi:Y+L amino acid transporter 2-like [Macrobrachium rosenbergii]|uniref:Y+L amino acid transporter 2-like n=1 Tax=Macrobrachium rosenbergii TaxID=79674 RepID=UPI0034D65C05
MPQSSESDEMRDNTPVPNEKGITNAAFLHDLDTRELSSGDKSTTPNALERKPAPSPDGSPSEESKQKKKKKKEKEIDDSNSSVVELKKELGLANGVGIIVGIMIGSGIFVSPGNVVRYTGSVGMSLMVWVASGLMTMFGALCYSEMGTMIPRSGGSYTYILEAFGPVPAFLTLWINLVIQSPGSRAIGMITFANYLLQPLFPNCSAVPYLAVRFVALSMLGLATYVNCAGVRFGTRLQDSLTITKTLALILVIVVGIHHLARGHVENYVDAMAGTIYNPASIATAFYSSGFAYGGWNALNSVLEELKDPYKNLPRAIAISIASVTLIYTLTNVAYFAVLTPSEVLSSNAVAVTFGNRTLGILAWVISIFVACSTYGNLNGGLMTQSRVVYAGAREGHLPRFLTLIHVHNKTPVVSLVCIVILPAIMLFVPDVGSILAYTSFTGSVVSIMSVSSLLWLRYKEPDRHRPIKVWLGFPIIYLIMCVFVAVFPIIRRPVEIGVGAFAFAVGLLVYYVALHLKIKPIGDAMEKVMYVCQLLFLCVEEEKAQ